MFVLNVLLQSWVHKSRGKFDMEGFKGFFGLHFHYLGKRYLMDYGICVIINTCV